jgi:membrane protein DedA with SNARE-associated domain
VASLAGAVVHVPIALGAGYAAGYGLGDRVERLRRRAGAAENAILVAALVAIVVVVAGAWLGRARRGRSRS